MVHLNILSKQCCVRDWISVHWDRILWRLMAGMAVCNTLCKVLYVLHCEYGGVCEYGHQMVWGRQPGPRLQDCEGLESWVTSWSGKIQKFVYKHRKSAKLIKCLAGLKSKIEPRRKFEWTQLVIAALWNEWQRVQVLSRYCQLAKVTRIRQSRYCPPSHGFGWNYIQHKA